ncbi:MAG TPA: hypothetical protein ENK31_10620, partial [Nannocystis exedens]|nr:hypothetical protein [Nannocystis exedens]
MNLRKLRSVLYASLLTGAFLGRPTPLYAATPTFEESLFAWDLEGAELALSELNPGPVRRAREGMLAVYRADYARAEELLTTALASADFPEDPATQKEARHYLALARGSQRALGTAIVMRSSDGSVEVVFADARDTLLAPYLFGAMEIARQVLGSELGVPPDQVIRFEILDDPAKLALVTPLTL